MAPLVVTQRYSNKDTILYALGVGAGLAAAKEPKALRFVFERALVPLTTMATILAYPGFWSQDPKYGITWRKLLHRDQSVEIHAPLPTEGELRGEVCVDEIYDRGTEKGALMCFSRRIFDVASGTHLATVRQVNLLRADGGFGGPPDTLPSGHKPPGRNPDIVLALSTNVDQAMLYRLLGDLNPLHIDPEVAKGAGFERPILHGLSSFGVAGLAATIGLCAYDARRVRRLDTSFSNPVYPGETLEVSLWIEAPGIAALEARVVERNVNVMRNGYVEYDFESE